MSRARVVHREGVEYMDAAAPKALRVPRFGSAEEAAIVRRLIRHLAKAGFRPHSLAIQSEGYVRTPTARAALCELFEWDDFCTLRFKRARETDLHGVLLIQGNGTDIVSDWSLDSDYNKPLPGSFHAAMEAFNDAEEARDPETQR